MLDTPRSSVYVLEKRQPSVFDSQLATPVIDLPEHERRDDEVFSRVGDELRAALVIAIVAIQGSEYWPCVADKCHYRGSSATGSPVRVAAPALRPPLEPTPRRGRRPRRREAAFSSMASAITVVTETWRRSAAVPAFRRRVPPGVPRRGRRWSPVPWSGRRAPHARPRQPPERRRPARQAADARRSAPGPRTVDEAYEKQLAAVKAGGVKFYWTGAGSTDMANEGTNLHALLEKHAFTVEDGNYISARRPPLTRQQHRRGERVQSARAAVD